MLLVAHFVDTCTVEESDQECIWYVGCIHLFWSFGICSLFAGLCAALRFLPCIGQEHLRVHVINDLEACYVPLQEKV